MEKRVLDASGIVGQAEGPFEVSYNSRDLLAYALGIGCRSSGQQQQQSSCCDGDDDGDGEFRFLYEGSPGFAAFPTYPVVLPYKGISSNVVPFPGRTLFLIPKGLRNVVDTGAILHYDQSMEMFQPLDPKGAELDGRSVVLGVYRRRGGVLLRTKTTLTDRKSGRALAETTQGTFMRGLEILGDAGPPLPPRSTSPTEPPDAVIAVAVSTQQALLYRLSGDYNAIHADPEAARAAGLDGPILHGLCSLGIAARQILLFFCPGDPSGLLSLYCRFARTVVPGDVLEIKLWGDVVSHGGAGGKEDSMAHKMHHVGARAGAGVGTGVGTGVKTGETALTREKVKDRRDGRAAPAPRLGGGTAIGVSNDEQHPHVTFVAKSPERTQQVVRFEVCSPRQGGAVVVADGRAVVGRRLGEGVGVVVGEGAPANRARL